MRCVIFLQMPPAIINSKITLTFVQKIKNTVLLLTVPYTELLCYTKLNRRINCRQFLLKVIIDFIFSQGKKLGNMFMLFPQTEFGFSQTIRNIFISYRDYPVFETASIRQIANITTDFRVICIGKN